MHKPNIVSFNLKCFEYIHKFTPHSPSPTTTGSLVKSRADNTRKKSKVSVQRSVTHSKA